MTPSERSLHARAAALAMHARNDSREIAARGQAGLLRRFENEVDPDEALDPRERARRAQLLLRAHMTRLAIKSAKARKRRGG